MKKLLTSVICSIALLFNVSAFAKQGPEIGKPAPDFVAVATNGETINLKDLRGDIVVLEWFNHDCPFVKKHYEAQNMQHLQKEFTGKGVKWFTIISSAPGKQGNVTAAEANKQADAWGASPTAIILDPTGAIGRAYNAKTTPDMFIIDAKGMLVYKGAIDSNPSTTKGDIKDATNYVAADLNNLLAGKPAQYKQTKPYGCAIKYS